MSPWLATISYPTRTHGIIVNYTGKIVISRMVISGFHCISSFHHKMWHKKLVASKAVHFFTTGSSQCLAGSYLAGHLVCFSFVVVIQ